MKSIDGGQTWSAPSVVAQLDTVGVTDPNTGAPVRNGDVTPEPAINPSTGDLYVVWQDGRCVWDWAMNGDVAAARPRCAWRPSRSSAP